MSKKEPILNRKPKIPKIITDKWLIKQLKNVLTYENKTIDYRNKFKMKFDDYSYYLNQIYNTYNIDDFEPELEFCDTDKQKKTWLYFRLKISSFEYCHSKGRIIKILIRDKKTKKYVGIASLGSEVRCKIFDEYIGWDNNIKFEGRMFSHIMNITTCVAIPPFSFNYNGGKLIAMLMFSSEVLNISKKSIRKNW